MALSTAGDVISKALQMIGVYGASQTIADDDASLCLDLLNAMMDEWSNYNLACYDITEQSLVLVPGQATYTIGPGGFVNGQRPLSILSDPGTAYIQDSNGNNYPMEVVPRDKWNMYANRSSIITSNFPTILFYDPQFPLGVINVTPYPNEAYTMFFDSMLQLAEYASLTTPINLPPGYAAAMYSNLAVLAFPFFLDGQISPNIPAAAARTLGAIKRTNQRKIYANFDQEIVSRAGLSYNIYTDTAGSVVSST